MSADHNGMGGIAGGAPGMHLCAFNNHRLVLDVLSAADLLPAHR